MMRSLFVLVAVLSASATSPACEPGGLLWKVTHPIQAIREARQVRSSATCSASAPAAVGCTTTTSEVVQVVTQKVVQPAAPVFVQTVAMNSAPVFVQRDETPGRFVQMVNSPVSVPRSIRVFRAPFTRCVGGLCFSE